MTTIDPQTDYYTADGRHAAFTRSYGAQDDETTEAFTARTEQLRSRLAELAEAESFTITYNDPRHVTVYVKLREPLV